MIKALLFDVFGTVVDWRSGIAREVETCFAGRGQKVDGAAFATAWRRRYHPAMAPIREGRRRYVALDILHRENLDATLEEFGLAGVLDEADRKALNRAWEKLPPWADSVPGLTSLKARFAIAPCSNGSIALMTWLARYGHLPWDAILGAEIAQSYKPNAVVYLASVRALGLRPEEAVMVAAHNGDLEAARAAGLQTAFIARPDEHGPGQTTDLEPTSDWEFAASDLCDLASQMAPEIQDDGP